MKRYKKKRIVRRKRRISEREIMRIKRKLKKSAKKLHLGAKRTGAYVYGTLRRIVGNPGYGWAKNDIKLLGTSLKIEKGERVRYVEATNIPGGGVFVRPYYPKGIWKMQSEDTSIHLSPTEFSEEISMSEPRGEYRPTPQVAPAWKYGIYTGRGVVRKNPATKARPIPGKFYRVYWSHPSRGETGQITFTGDQLLKIKSVTELSRYWPIKEGLKMAKVHFRGPYDSWDDAFMDR